MATEALTPGTRVGPRALPGRAEARPGSTARFVAWARGHILSIGIVAALLLVAGAVLGTGVAGYPKVVDDEGTYVSQAWAILSQGSLAHYTYWYDHPPLGWVQLALVQGALAPFTGDGNAVEQARTVMLLPALASGALLYVLARRLGIRREWSAIAVLMFTLSPLAIPFLRQVYLDNFATPWILAAFVLAASPKRRLWAFAGCGACFAIAALSKETTMLVLPGLLLQVRQGLDRRTRSFCTAAFAVVLALVLFGYPLFALLKGELVPGPGHVSLYEAVRWQLFGRASSGSPLEPHSASHGLVFGWIGTDSWLLGLGTLGALASLAVRRLRPVAITLLLLVASMLRPGYLPQPFIIVLLPFCALLAAAFLDSVTGALARRIPRPKLAAVAISAAVAAALAVAIAPGWSKADGTATSTDLNSTQRAASAWVVKHVDHRARVLVDDTYYVDLVRAGFRPRLGAVWFFKLDFTTNLDPSVARALPNGWRSFDYVVSSQVIRESLVENPGGMQQVREALHNSRIVAAFGTGPQRVEIRRVAGRGSGALR
jgi:hypothetical protein